MIVHFQLLRNKIVLHNKNYQFSDERQIMGNYFPRLIPITDNFLDLFQ